MIDNSFNEDTTLLQAINEAVLDKKGDNIVNIDLRNISGSVTNYFVICSANSITQVRAIAENIERKIRTDLKEKTWHSEGYENCVWVLLDYVSIVVHVFEKESREFYKLENLWGDAVFSHIGPDGKIIKAS